MPLAQLRHALSARLQGLDRYAGVDGQELRTFIRRLSAAHHDDHPWLESVMTLVGKTPPQKWADEQRLHAIEYLGDLAVRLRDLETLERAVRERPAPDHEVILLRTVSSTTGEQVGRIACIRPEQRPIIDAQARHIGQLLARLDNQEPRLAILARLLQTED